MHLQARAAQVEEVCYPPGTLNLVPPARAATETAIAVLQGDLRRNTLYYGHTLTMWNSYKRSQRFTIRPGGTLEQS